jgi:hypothetical protein
MTSSSRDHDTCCRFLDRHGTTFADEVQINLKDEPAPLFQLLIASELFSARISADLAAKAGRALFREAGWTTPRKMQEAGWEARVKVLNRSGYARYDESTSRMIGENCEFLEKEYRGDLRNLREAAEKDPDREHRLLKDFKGVGDVGAAIFRREVQLVWDEQFPFTDKKAAQAAAKAGLPDQAEELAGLVQREDFPRLVCALVRADLAGELDRDGEIGDD